MFDSDKLWFVSGFLRNPWNLVMVGGVSPHIWDIYVNVKQIEINYKNDLSLQSFITKT